MNNEFLRELHLSPEKIARDLDISIGLARTYQQRYEESREDDTIILSVAATYFRRAAANALLLGRYSDGKRLFLNASSVYQRLGLPYSVVVASLSSEGSSVTEPLSYRWLGAYADHEIAERAIPQMAYVVLAQMTFPESGRMSLESLVNVRRSLDPYWTQPLGALGISVGSLLDLFDSLVPDIEQRRVNLAEALTPLLGIYNIAIRQAIQNRYQWERLAFPFHPADPNIYGILTLTNSALQKHHDYTVQRFIEQTAISRESRYLLNTIFEGIAGNQQERNIPT